MRGVQGVQQVQQFFLQGFLILSPSHLDWRFHRWKRSPHLMSPACRVSLLLFDKRRGRMILFYLQRHLANFPRFFGKRRTKI